MFSHAENHRSRSISRFLTWVTGLLMVPFTGIKSRVEKKMLLLM